MTLCFQIWGSMQPSLLPPRMQCSDPGKPITRVNTVTWGRGEGHPPCVSYNADRQGARTWIRHKTPKRIWVSRVGKQKTSCIPMTSATINLYCSEQWTQKVCQDSPHLAYFTWKGLHCSSSTKAGQDGSAGINWDLNYLWTGWLINQLGYNQHVGFCMQTQFSGSTQQLHGRDWLCWWGNRAIVSCFAENKKSLLLWQGQALSRWNSSEEGSGEPSVFIFHNKASPLLILSECSWSLCLWHVGTSSIRPTPVPSDKGSVGLSWCFKKTFHVWEQVD